MSAKPRDGAAEGGRDLPPIQIDLRPDVELDLDLDGALGNLLPERRFLPDLVFQVQRPVANPFLGEQPSPEDGCLSQAEAAVLADEIERQIRPLVPTADVVAACVPLSRPQPDPWTGEEVQRTATTLGVWGFPPIPGEDRGRVLEGIDLLDGRASTLSSALAAIFVSGRFLRAQLAAELARQPVFVERSDVSFQAAAGTVTTEVTARQLRKNGKPGRLKATLRFVETPRAASSSFVPCQEPPPAVAVDTDRNFTGDVLDWLRPLRTPDLGVLGFLVLSGFYVPRLPVPRANPADVAFALDFNYESFRVGEQGELEGITARAEAKIVEREPCLVIQGPSTVTVRPGSEVSPAFVARPLDLRPPFQATWSGEGASPVSANALSTAFTFDVGKIPNGGTVSARIFLELRDADGFLLTAERRVRVSVPFIAKPLRVA